MEFTADDILSAVAGDGNTLVIRLTDGKAATLESTLRTFDEKDTLTIGAGFLVDQAGNVTIPESVLSNDRLDR